MSIHFLIFVFILIESNIVLLSNLHFQLLNKFKKNNFSQYILVENENNHFVNEIILKIVRFITYFIIKLMVFDTFKFYRKGIIS